MLDEVAAGETVVIRRRGLRLVLRREEIDEVAEARLPDYSRLIDVPDADHADEWSWDWSGGELQFVDRGKTV